MITLFPAAKSFAFICKAKETQQVQTKTQLFKQKLKPCHNCCYFRVGGFWFFLLVCEESQIVR